MKRRLPRAFLALGFACFLLAGCHTDMWRQPKAVAQGEFSQDVFADGMADRPPVAGAIARGGLRQDALRYKGRDAGKLARRFPATLTIHGETLRTDRPADVEKILLRGQERFMIFCRHCHGAIGDGKGMIARRGLALRRPPGNYHTDRLRKMPIGHFFDVMTNGFGAMFPYGTRIDVDDRWAIAAYIRALQLSQNVPASSLSPEETELLDSAETPAAGGHP
jgi:mono/diheme cytochrome c family protein